MRRLFTFLASLILFFMLISPHAKASGFQLQNIGSMSVDGITYDHLYYTSGNVTFSGIGIAGQTVTISIDADSYTTQVNDSGNWSHQATLTEGDHSMVFASDAGSVSFTLTIGAVPEGVGGLPAAQTPTAGNSTPLIMMLASGIILLLFPLVILKRKE